MALLLGLQRRMFSGFRSQWMMLSSGVARKSSAVHSCWANFRVRLSETPRKLVFRSRSYKLYDSISNTRQRWFRNMKCRFRWTAGNQFVTVLVEYRKWFSRVSYNSSEKQITDVVFHLGIMFVHQLQEAHFYLGLIEKSFLVLDDLNGDPFLLDPVIRFHNLKWQFKPVRSDILIFINTNNHR